MQEQIITFQKTNFNSTPHLLVLSWVTLFIPFSGNFRTSDFVTGLIFCSIAGDFGVPRILEGDDRNNKGGNTKGVWLLLNEFNCWKYFSRSICSISFVLGMFIEGIIWNKHNVTHEEPLRPRISMNEYEKLRLQLRNWTSMAILK